MKKNPVSGAAPAALIVLLLLAALGGCSGKEPEGAQSPGAASGQNAGNVQASAAPAGRLYIYNWTYYTPLSVIEKFEAEYGVDVIYDVFASNEEMYAKLQAGGSGYDVIFPSGDYVSIMINQGMLERIDRSKLSNLGNIDPQVLQKTAYDPLMDYSVPYYWGAAGIAVNTSKVPVFERSWSIFSRADLKNRMTMLDDMREVMGDALVHLGYSVNTDNPAQIAAARDLVNNVWKPNLTKFDAEAFGKGYANGEFWVVQGYAEGVYEEIADNKDLIASTVFFIPSEGGPAYIDSMCIPKGAQNPDLAHKFIDFIHRPAIYAEFADTFGFPATVNIPARPLKASPPHYTLEDVADKELKDNIGEALELYDDAWFNSIRVGD
ncbi:MAG: extracellular solute-binding protein [Spirochaetaceae bacterium]|jgi:spermidine/putrescine transport system substrate-binding protein|nr:extracellular solute-binding protein [Spirochaetaceae bacterium]